MKTTFVYLLVLALFASAGSATVITVDGAVDGTLASLENNGTCDLREALEAANGDSPVDVCPAGSGADTIDFDPTVNAIQLISGQLLITAALTISGPGQQDLVITQTTVDSRLLEIDDGVPADAAVIVSALELRGGSVEALSGVAGFGGAILNREDLTLDEVTLAGNAAANGGAIFSTGKLLIRLSKLLDSSATGGSGVLVCEADSICRLEDTVVRGGSSASGPAFGRMSDSTELDVVRSEMSDFTGPAGVHALEVNNVFLYIENSTYSDADVAFLSIDNGSQAELEFTTVAGAQAGLLVSENAILNIRASILEGELTKFENPPLNVPLIVANFSVFSHPGVNASFFTLQSANSFANARLGPLRNNGGPSRTHDLEPNSPARNKVSMGSSPCDTIMVDQRGLARPHEDFCDAGAVESGSGVIFSDGFEG